MKLIYYGLFNRPSDCENLLVNSLMKAGVLVYRWQKMIGSTKSNWLDFVEFVQKEKIDVVLISKAPELVKENLLFLKHLTNCKVIWWTFDWMNHPQVKNWYFPLAKVSDICFQTDGFGEEEIYKVEGINRIELHQGIDNSLHFFQTWGDVSDELSKKDMDDYECDVAFFGSLYSPKRIELDKFLRENYGKKYKLYGGSSGYNQGLWNREFRKAVSLSKIIVGDNFTNDIPGYWSDRIYLTTGCGGFFLTHYVEGLEKEFEIGFNKEIDTWSTFEELKQKIDLYLNPSNNFIRYWMSKRACEKTQTNHTYDKRINVFLNKLEKINCV